MDASAGLDVDLLGAAARLAAGTVAEARMAVRQAWLRVGIHSMCMCSKQPLRPAAQAGCIAQHAGSAIASHAAPNAVLPRPLRRPPAEGRSGDTSSGKWSSLPVSQLQQPGQQRLRPWPREARSQPQPLSSSTERQRRMAWHLSARGNLAHSAFPSPRQPAPKAQLAVDRAGGALGPSRWAVRVGAASPLHFARFLLPPGPPGIDWGALQ